MLERKERISLSPERQNLILGQFGNMRAIITQAQRALVDAQETEFIPILAAVLQELDYLERYFPSPDDDTPF
jgi:hypothetical protein